MAGVLFPFAVLIRVAFAALLRPGEVVNLLVGDIRLPSAFGSQSAVIAIRSPKTRAVAGRVQFALLRDAGVMSWLSWLLEGLPRSVRIWPTTMLRVRSVFQQVLARAGLKSLKLTPASLRAGGATTLIANDVDIGRVKFLGRWQSERSLASYIQEAMAQLTWLDLDTQQQALIRHLNVACSWAWSQPPLVPWTSLFSRRRQWRTLRSQTQHGQRFDPSRPQAGRRGAAPPWTASRVTMS